MRNTRELRAIRAMHAKARPGETIVVGAMFVTLAPSDACHFPACREGATEPAGYCVVKHAAFAARLTPPARMP